MTAAAADDDDDELDAEEVQALFQAALARTREVPEGLETGDLLTLALPPFWPEPLLQRVVGSADAVEALLGRAGPLVHARGRPGERAIELVDPDNAEIVTRVRKAPGLLERIAALAGQIRRCGIKPPPILEQWIALVELLEARGDYEVARDLTTSVGEACRLGRPGSVQDRLEAAAALARTFGPPLSGAVRAAQHRIQRWHRIQRDQRKLAYFVPRGPALAAFDRLRTGAEREWALHYIGVGGTGKTSLIRYLATQVAVDQDLQVARIDFDHLSPTYPARDPGQLFATLLYELAPLIETERQDKLLGFLDSALESLRQNPVSVTSNVHAILDTPAVAELTSWFGSLLQTFPRPTFILDTCEELTKLELVDGLIPSVEATFLLLERFHELAPSLRVVFAGRRLLAREYANWTVPEEVARYRGVSMRRDYVRLHELRGFDRSEAVAYLEKRLPISRRTDSALVEKLLALSPEPLRVQALAVKDAGATEPHYNPFDLSRYGDWVEAEPEVGTAALDAAGVDPYVEVRIIHRMGRLDALLPAVALLRRFDAAMLGDALAPGADPRPVFDELARYEWLRVKELPERTILEVDRGLPERIERVLAVNRGFEIERARVQLGGKLRERISAAKLPAIPVEVFDGALRLLPAEEAGALWRSIEQRIDAEADWAWAAELGHDLIADGYVAESAESGVRIYILATMASALIHAGALAEAGRLWREIEEGATAVLERCGVAGAGAAVAGRRRPGTASPAWLLRQRARLGRVAARASSAASGELGELARSVVAVAGELEQGGRAHELDTSLCAALEALVEAGERTPEPRLPELLVLRPLARALGPGLEAFGMILAARLEMLGAPGDLAPVAIATLALSTDDPGLPATLLDWRPPESLRDRLRLELVRMNRYLDDEPAGAGATLRSVMEARAPGWLAEANTATTDGDRLAAALALYHGATPSPSMVRWTTTPGPRAETLVWTGEERCAAHRQYPPLAVALARLALCRGELEAARAAITELPQPWTTRLACEIARWSRSVTDLDSIAPVEFLDEHTAFEIVSARAIVEEATVAGRIDLLTSWPHLTARTVDELDQLLEKIRPLLDELGGELGDEAPLSRARSSLIVQEAIALSRHTEAPAAPRPLREPPPLQAIHPDLREEAIRQQLRAHALDRARGYGGPTNRATITAAIEEAELLDLRLPDLAAGLFAWAAQAAENGVHAGLAGLAGLAGRARSGAQQAARHAARSYGRGAPEEPRQTGPATDDRQPTIRIQAAFEKKAGLILEADPPLTGAIHAEIQIPGLGIPPRFEDHDLVAAVHALAQRADHVAIQIIPDPSLSSRSWEAAVYSIDPAVSLARLDCYRLLPGGPPGGPATPGPLQIMASGSIERILLHAWQQRTGVVHVVRRFGRSLQGQIEITQDYQRHQSDRPASLEELQLADAKLLVLQCDPVDAGPQIAADLAEPELARKFAMTAIRRTAAAALILPPLPVDLVVEVADLLAREAGDLSSPELVSAARAVRIYLASRDNVQLAQEVTLVLRRAPSRKESINVTVG